MEGVRLHASGCRDSAADLGEIGLNRIDFDEEGSGARNADGFEKRWSGLETGTQLVARNTIGFEQFGPDRNPESGAGVTADIAAAKIILLGHADGGIPIIIEEEDLEVELIDRHGAKFL